MVKIIHKKLGVEVINDNNPNIRDYYYWNGYQMVVESFDIQTEAVISGPWDFEGNLA